MVLINKNLAQFVHRTVFFSNPHAVNDVIKFLVLEATFFKSNEIFTGVIMSIGS